MTAEEMVNPGVYATFIDEAILSPGYIYALYIPVMNMKIKTQWIFVLSIYGFKDGGLVHPATPDSEVVVTSTCGVIYRPSTGKVHVLKRANYDMLKPFKKTARNYWNQPHKWKIKHPDDAYRLNTKFYESASVMVHNIQSEKDLTKFLSEEN